MSYYTSLSICFWISQQHPVQGLWFVICDADLLRISEIGVYFKKHVKLLTIGGGFITKGLTMPVWLPV